ncbi:MAG TPA: hypothetical protein VG755_04795 [Nannocystaceae bacterium]|nr:hypothetical protein [Nannocystaceae bacterium]
MGRRSLVVALLLAAACGPVVAVEGDTGSSSGAGTTGPLTTSVGSSSTTVGVTTSTETSTSTTGTSDSSDDVDDTGIMSAGFICHGCFGPDGGSFHECDIWQQDCPDGEKCMPWAGNGGNTWNSTRCSPLDPMPAAVGEACTVEGSGVSGIDSCDIAAMCFGVDPKTNMGTCAALCGGNVGMPICADGLSCLWSFNESVPICLVPCDPLAPDCGVDACALEEQTGTFWCVPAIMVGETAYAESCDAPFTCGSDFVCAAAENVPACATESCCTTRCDPAMPLPCPDEAAGQTCIPLEVNPSVGYCGIAM